MLSLLSSFACGSISSRERPEDVLVAQHGCVVYKNVEMRKYYDVKDILGVPGTFGEVRTCIDKKTGQALAVKILKRMPCLEDVIHNECEISQRLDHPHCGKTLAIFQCKKKVCLIMPTYEGGDLFDKVVSSGGCLSEGHSAAIIKPLLEAIVYLHELKIAHCDVKLSNILFTKLGDVKLIDFGVSQFVGGEDGMLHREVGSPSFIAPEVLMGSYNELCDMWSVGIVAFILICGFNPFNPRALPALRFRQKISEAVLKGFTPTEKSGFGAFFPKSKQLSEEARDFISHLLTADWRSRMTAAEALNHPWIQGKGTSTC